MPALIKQTYKSKTHLVMDEKVVSIFVSRELEGISRLRKIRNNQMGNRARRLMSHVKTVREF